MTRLEANIIILDRLSNYLKKYPDMRFNQAIFNLGITRSLTGSNFLLDEFHVESEEILKRMGG